MDRKEFAAALTERLEKIPEARRDWYEALVAAALDETRGDLKQALELADREFAASPDGPGE